MERLDRLKLATSCPTTAALLAAALLVGCHSLTENEIVVPSEHDFTAVGFTAAIPPTRTVLTDAVSGITVGWAAADRTGLFVEVAGDRTAVNVEYSADNSAPTSSFRPVADAAKWRDAVSGHTISAYYPYNSAATDPTAVPITIASLQHQSAAGNTDHLAESDFLYAFSQNVVRPADGTVALTFTHPLSILELKLSALLDDVEVSKLIFRCTDADEVVSASGATIDLTDGTLDFTGATVSNEVAVEVPLSLTTDRTDKVFMQLTPGHGGKRFKIIAVVGGREVELAEKGIPSAGLPEGSQPTIALTVPPRRNNGIWIKSADFAALKAAGFASLAANGINALIVNEAVITGNKMTVSAFKTSVDAAAAAGIDVHLWIKCFNNGSWVNPIDTETKQFNQPYFDTIISRTSAYAAYGNLAGIHLDYVRYPGTAQNYNYSTTINGQTAITEFCRQLSVAVKAIDPDLVISAALMNETSANATYYGQNTRTMSEWVDVLIPMVYRYYFGSSALDHGADWISTTTKWFADEVAAAGYGAEVWAGIMTYKPLNAAESSIERLSASQLKTDCGLSLQNTSSVATGAKGVVLFRYGVVNYFDMMTLYE